MKLAARILSLLILAGLSSFYMACDDPKGGEDSEIDQQIAKLDGNWDATTVTLDGVAPPVDQSEFKLELNGTAGDPNLSFIATRPSGLSAWPASGTIKIDADNPTTVLIRNDGGGETVTVNYSVSENTLVMDFTFDGDAFDAGRTKNVKGNWHYEFTKL